MSSINTLAQKLRGEIASLQAAGKDHDIQYVVAVAQFCRQDLNKFITAVYDQAYLDYDGKKASSGEEDPNA